MRSKSLSYLCMLLGMLLAYPAFAVVGNIGFETGSTSGWDLDIPVGGSAEVVRVYTGVTRSYPPVSGNYFLELKTDGPGSYTTASQMVTLEAGETIGGYAAFICQEFSFYNDDAYIEVLDDGGSVIDTPWSESCESAGYPSNTPWTDWSFTANGSGTYTLTYRVANFDDSAVDAYALFDGDQKAFSIPTLNGLGLMVLILLMTSIGWVAIRLF